MPENYHRIEECHGSYTPNAAPPAAPVSRLLTARAAHLTPEPLEWLWRPVLSLGNLGLLVGDPDSGKSLVALDIAARVSRGAEWPGGGTAPGGEVLLVDCEDDPKKTVWPRLKAAGADLDRIHLFCASETAKGGLDALSLERDEGALAAWLGAHSDTRLLILDPFAAALGGRSGESGSRALFHAYAQLALRHQIAIVGIVPFAKPLCGRALYRASAALAFTSAARHIYAVGRDRAEPRRRLLVRVKNTLSGQESGFAFTIEAPDGGEPSLMWEDTPLAVAAEDALLPREDAVARAQRTEAEMWLLDKLADGPMRTGLLRNLAPSSKIGWRSVERAKARLGIDAVRQQSHWEWRLPAREAAEGEEAGPAVRPAMTGVAAASRCAA